MKIEILQQLWRMSKFIFYGITLQFILAGVILAKDGAAQNKKLGEIYIKVNISEEKANLQELFTLVETKSDFRFAYNSKEINLNQEVQVSKGKQTLLQLLSTISQETALNFKRVNRSIYVNNREVKSTLAKVEEVIAIEAISVSGKVTDSAGNPLPGVNIVIKGTSSGTVSDLDGKYIIEVEEGETLVFSSIGYIAKEVVVSTQQAINVSLEDDLSQLEEVVVIGYGEVKKSDLTGSVVNIKAEEITKLAVPSFDNAIQGRLPGVEITSSSGQPGSETGIKIRGGTSISGGNQPLVVIDGVPINNQGVTDGTINSAGINPLSLINPNDIASIEVLKDASAAAIYGARAGNGVILITTKKGKTGAPEISLNSFVGVQNVLDRYDIRNAREFAELANRANAQQFYTQAEINALGEGTDWQDAILREAITSNVNVGVRGGSTNSDYYVSLDYFNQEGVIINTGLERYAFRANLNTTLNKFKFGSRITYSVSDGNLSNSGQTPGQENSGVAPIKNAVLRDPITPIRDADGNFTTFPEGRNVLIDTDNPVAILEDGVSRSKSGRFIGNFFGEYEIVQGLKFKSSISLDLMNRREEYYVPRTSLIGSLTSGLASIGVRDDNSWINENILSYNKEFGNSSLNVVAGTAFQGFTGAFSEASAQGFASDLTEVNNLASAQTILSPRSALDEWSIASFFGRVNYILNDKYLFTLNGRYDGSSRFGANNKWGFFPSAAAAWKIHKENFLESSSKISQLKLRVSYGRTGNQDIAPFQSLPLLSPQTIALNGTPSTSFYVSRVANPDLRWETTDQFNIGVDLGLFEQRIAIVADYYIKNTKDLLLAKNLPSTSGFRTALQNIGEIENRGFELGITSYNIDKDDFQWTTMVNFSSNQSEVLDLGEGVNQLFVGFVDNITKQQSGILQVGEEVGSFYGWVFDGIYQTDQGGDSHQPNSLAGDPIFRDLDGNGVLDGNDRTIIGRANPNFIYGITNNLRYKNLDVSIFIQGVYGNEIYNATLVDITGGEGTVLSEYLDNAWTPENPSNTYPRIDENQLNGWVRTHSGFIEDGSYLRLKNITVGYSLSAKLLEKLGLKTFRVYAAADNIATLTGYSGINPDVNTRPNDNLNTGLDDWIYPASRNYRLGLNITF